MTSTPNPIAVFKLHTDEKPVMPEKPEMPAAGSLPIKFRDYADALERYYSDVNNLHIRMGYWEEKNGRLYAAARTHIAGCYYTASQGKQAHEYLFDWCYKQNNQDIDAAIAQYQILVMVVRNFNEIYTSGNRRGR